MYWLDIGSMGNLCLATLAETHSLLIEDILEGKQQSGCQDALSDLGADA